MTFLSTALVKASQVLRVVMFVAAVCIVISMYVDDPRGMIGPTIFGVLVAGALHWWRGRNQADDRGEE